MTDRCGPRSSDGDDPDGNLELRLDESKILPHGLRERSLPLLRGGDPVGLGEIRPALELAVDWLAGGQHPHARGEFSNGLPVVAIAHAHWNPVEPAEHIELRHRKTREPVYAHRHPEHDEIEPANPPWAPSRRPVFASATFPQVFRGGPFD